MAGDARGQQAEVIVVGAGPAGAATAIHLARHGRRVLLLEGRDFSRPRPADMRSGEVLSPGAQVEIARLGLPAEGNWRLTPFEVLQNFWPNGRITYDRLPQALQFWQIDRGSFDRALFALAQAEGVEGRDACRVSNFLRDPNGAINGVVTKAGDRPGQELRVPLIVDAGGRRSALLARLKRKEAEREFRRIALVCFYQDFPGCEAGVWEQHFLTAHNTVVKGSLVRPGLFRFSFETDLAFRDAFAARYGKQTPHAMVLAMLQQSHPALYERFQAAHPLPYSVAYAPIGYRVRQITDDGLVMVGDAAGYLDPSTGQGIEFALRTARLAAASIEQALVAQDYQRDQFGAYLVGHRHEVETATNRLRFYLRMSRQRLLLNMFSYLAPGRALMLNSLVKPRPASNHQ